MSNHAEIDWREKKHYNKNSKTKIVLMLEVYGRCRIHDHDLCQLPVYDRGELSKRKGLNGDSSYHLKFKASEKLLKN
ncbi:hypothetical protein P5673_024696 [Acropora cervicornis]|uniref:Uncharacterized protein n=1 Tax=Acropora cervicornis TaxID=6130 RepID=A0AAD9Q435_ACRCE|nr:hypothetical protein P5673_024696 [Acropora cervicornis]